MQAFETAAEALLPMFRQFATGRYAIALGGSLAKRKGDRHSDLDIYIFADGVVSVEERLALIKRYAGEWPWVGCDFQTCWWGTCGDFGYRGLRVESTVRPVARADQVIAIGASRGGKTALLAGATDERFALTVANGSGCCGAGCFRFLGPQAETLQEMIEHAGFWLSPRLAEFVGRESELPLDQHFLKAAIAPRAMLTTEAMGDLCANPPGTWLTHAAARQAYRFLGVEDRIGISFRPGRHEHTLLDWQATLEFADWRFRSVRPGRSFNFCPFDDLPQVRMR